MSNKPIPKIGDLWPEQGGIFVGTILVDGKECHIITPEGTGHDLTKQTYDETEKAEFGEINGHSDWHVGDQEEFMLGYINTRKQFKCDGGIDSIYWTRSFHHGYPWAVDFENGDVLNYIRSYQFRVRPFRRFTH